MSNKTYDTLKLISAILIDSVAVLVGTIGTIWGFDFCNPIALTINAIGVCIGSVVVASSKVYKKNGGE